MDLKLYKWSTINSYFLRPCERLINLHLMILIPKQGHFGISSPTGLLVKPGNLDSNLERVTCQHRFAIGYEQRAEARACNGAFLSNKQVASPKSPVSSPRHDPLAGSKRNLTMSHYTFSLGFMEP